MVYSSFVESTFPEIVVSDIMLGPGNSELKIRTAVTFNTDCMLTVCQALFWI